MQAPNEVNSQQNDCYLGYDIESAEDFPPQELSNAVN